ncbi:MAG: hypothetical protein ABII00_12625 [Elusimicrobiota bacterium]
MADPLNFFESLLWFAVGAVLALGGARCARPLRPTAFLASALFALFGVSDLVEMRTGAWFEPWWLPAWKSACLLGLAAAGLRYRTLKRRGGGRR